YHYLSSTCSVVNPISTEAFSSVYFLNLVSSSYIYKPVAKKVRTVPTTMPPEYRVQRQLPENPLSNLLVLLVAPPDFTPGVRFTQERVDKLDLDPAKWLWPDELKLVQWLVKEHELAFAWDASERGQLDEMYFPPYKIPTVPHVPWAQRNIPILPATLDKVVTIIKEKITSGVYKPSTASYQLRWFCVVKKDGTSLWLV
ncbi:hypothetical protein CY34DRAFT_42355, partial [Suillus luteus UH-Slu-Lm8-n1]